MLLTAAVLLGLLSSAYAALPFFIVEQGGPTSPQRSLDVRDGKMANGTPIQL
jgi:hypothetical protein